MGWSLYILLLVVATVGGGCSDCSGGGGRRTRWWSMRRWRSHLDGRIQALKMSRAAIEADEAFAKANAI